MLYKPYDKVLLNLLAEFMVLYKFYSTVVYLHPVAKSSLFPVSIIDDSVSLTLHITTLVY